MKILRHAFHEAEWTAAHWVCAERRAFLVRNASVDSLLDQARQLMNVDDRRAIYSKVWDQKARDLPITYLWTWKNIGGLSAKVEGFVPIPDGLIRVQGIELA